MAPALKLGTRILIMGTAPAHSMENFDRRTPRFQHVRQPNDYDSLSRIFGTATIALISLNDFVGTVDLSASIAPSDTTASLSPVKPTVSFSPASVVLAANGTGASTMTVSSSLLTTPGTYTITVAANSGTISHSATVTVA